MTESVTHRQAILEELAGIVCKDRVEAYGDAEDNFADIAARWTLWLRRRTGMELTLNSLDVAAMMADMKLARLQINIRHDDSWRDLAGYAVCGGGIGRAVELSTTIYQAVLNETEFQ